MKQLDIEACLIGLTKIGPNIRMAAIMDYILDITVRKTPVVILEKKTILPEKEEHT